MGRFKTFDGNSVLEFPGKGRDGVVRFSMDEPAGARASGLEAALLGNRATLVRFLTSRTRDASEAEDIVQEMYLRLARTPSGPIADPLAYLYRMGLNLVVDRARGRERRARREGEWGDATTSRLGDDLVDQRPSPFSELVGRQREARMEAALKTMAPGAAQAFLLHKVEGLSHSEVAAKLCISRKAVEKRMAVAFRHLAKELKE